VQRSYASGAGEVESGSAAFPSLGTRHFPGTPGICRFTTVRYFLAIVSKVVSTVVSITKHSFVDIDFVQDDCAVSIFQV